MDTNKNGKGLISCRTAGTHSCNSRNSRNSLTLFIFLFSLFTFHLFVACSLGVNIEAWRQKAAEANGNPPGPGPLPPAGTAYLTKLTIGVGSERFEAALGAPISDQTLEELGDFQLGWAGLEARHKGTVKARVLNGPVSVEYTASKGSTVSITNGLTTVVPSDLIYYSFDYFNEEPESITCADGQFIIVEVISDDWLKYNYYRIDVSAQKTDATLASVAVAGRAPITLPQPGADWAAAAQTDLALTGNDIGQSLEITAVATDAEAATVSYWTGAANAEPAWVDTNSFVFTEGELFGIKVVAENQVDTNYYKWSVKTGKATATLSGITVDGKTASLGTPNAVIGSAVAGAVTLPYNFGDLPAAFPVVATVTSLSDATSEYTFAADAASAVFGTSAVTIPAAETDALYIKVTAENRVTVQYYKVTLSYVARPLMRTEGIRYASAPVVYTSGTVDSQFLADDNYEFVIERRWANDSTGMTANTARGIAKALWDETGLHVFVRIADASVGIPTGEPAQNVSHNYDSVEIFVNERVDSNGNVFTGNGTSGGSGNAVNSAYVGRGAQYRVGASGFRACDPTATLQAAWGASKVAGTGTGTTTTSFPKLAWTITASDPLAISLTDGGAKIGGYIVTTKVPWRFAASGLPFGTAESTTGAPNALAAPWPVANEKKIGIEFQINQSNVSTGTRYGVITAYNNSIGNYQSCLRWGTATLYGKQ